MSSETDDLIAWCEGQQAESLRQIDLFGAEGVKAFLQMRDGSTMDITSGVASHQAENVAMFGRLAAALKAR